jgi:hypothetical protein
MNKLSLGIIILLVVSLLLGCSHNLITTNTDIDYIEGTYGKEWDQIQWTFHEDAIPDKETAINVANSIMTGMQKAESKYQGLVIVGLFYDTVDKIWVVSFSKGPHVLGGMCMALRQDDGCVIKMWAAE